MIISPAFAQADIPPFCIDRTTQEGLDLILHYILESAGPTLSIRDKYQHDTLATKVEVVAGGWYHTYGRWSLLERYTGSLRCTAATPLKVIDPTGLRNEFFVERPFLSRRLKVTLESERLGLLEFRCQSIHPQPFQTLVFDKQRQLWIDRDVFLASL